MLNEPGNLILSSRAPQRFFLQNLKLIDHAFVAKGESGVDSINLIKPNFYFKGNDYKKNEYKRFTNNQTKK